MLKLSLNFSKHGLIIKAEIPIFQEKVMEESMYLQFSMSKISFIQITLNIKP